MKEETDKQTALIQSVNEMVDKIDSRSRLNETFIWYYKNNKFFKNFSKKLFFKRLGLKND